MASTSAFPPECARRYRPVRLLGQGGHGTVWLAEQGALARPVAVKLLLPFGRQDATLVARFNHEARVTAGLRHPGIVVVLDHGVEDGAPWIVYEYLPGRTLGRFLAESATVPWRAATEIARQLAAAVEAMHASGVLHRDLKPPNVIEAAPDRWKVADFGIAKSRAADAPITRTGEIFGTPAYMAPELFTEPASEQSDVYALGLIYYELLLGRLPLTTYTAASYFEFHKNTKPAPRLFRPDLPPGVDEVVAWSTAPGRFARCPSARDLRQALEALLADPPPPRRRVAPRVSSALVPLSVLGAVLLAGLHSVSGPREVAPVARASSGEDPADLAPVERAVGDLHRRYVERGPVYVRIGQLERGEGGEVDLAAAARLQPALLSGELADLGEIRELESRLQGGTTLEARSLRARLRGLAFLDWERSVYLRHDAEVLRGAGGGAVELIALLPRFGEAFYPVEGCVRFESFLDAVLDLLARVPPETRGGRLDLAPLADAVRTCGRRAHDARWLPAAAESVRRAAARFEQGLAELTGPLGRQLGAVFGALFASGWHARALSQDSDRSRVLAESLVWLAAALPANARLFEGIRNELGRRGNPGSLSQ